MELQYLFILNEDGSRVTSCVVGVHGDTMEAVKAYAAEHFPGKATLEGGEEEQQLFVDEGKLYVDGNFVNYVPSAAETQAAELSALDANYSTQLDDLKEQIIVASTVDQDEEYANELRQQRQDLQTEYIEKRGAL